MAPCSEVPSWTPGQRAAGGGVCPAMGRCRGAAGRDGAGLAGRAIAGALAGAARQREA